jgi:hypothetical protein
VLILLDASFSFDGGLQQCCRFLLLHRKRCWTYLSRGSYLLLGLRLGILRRCRYCLIRYFCHVEMSFRYFLLGRLGLMEDGVWKRRQEPASGSSAISHSRRGWYLHGETINIDTKQTRYVKQQWHTAGKTAIQPGYVGSLSYGLAT